MGESSKIRVCFLIDKLHRAGAQTHLVSLLRVLDRDTFEPSVCCLLEGGPLAEAARELGVPVAVLGLRTIYGPKAWVELVRFARRLRDEGVRVVHTYLVSANIYGAVAGRLAGVPVQISSRRDTGFSRNWRLRFVEEWLANPLVDRVVAVSGAAAEAAGRERWLKGKVVVIPNGVDLRTWDAGRRGRAAARKDWGVRDDEVAVGVVASLSPIKGHADFLRAAAMVSARHARCKFFVIGDGVLRQSLEKLAADLGVAGRVVFTGNRQDMPRMLSLLDLWVLPSHSEGMSNALLEAMAMELPVVATAVGGNLEVIQDGVTGLLTPPGDPGALAGAMDKLLVSPEVGRAMGRAARRRIEHHFAVERMGEQYERLYRDLAGRRQDQRDAPDLVP